MNDLIIDILDKSIKITPNQPALIKDGKILKRVLAEQIANMLNLKK